MLSKAPLTFRHAKHQPYRHAELVSASHRVVAWCYTSKDPFFFRHAELVSASHRGVVKQLEQHQIF
ncbi:MAG: hypothetical protein IJY58_03025 [Alphaproteobacteria bacterium]|nr:hypothetical protein [Alphaproteobacteria bacterium]